MPHIVAVTGHVETEYQIKAFECGMKQILAKPTNQDELAKILLELNYEFTIPPNVVKFLLDKYAENEKINWLYIV